MGAEKAMAQAQERVDEANNKTMEEDRKRFAEELRQQEESFRIEKATQEAKHEVMLAESQVNYAFQLGEPVTEAAAKDASPEGMLQAVQAVEEALAGAKVALDRT